MKYLKKFLILLGVCLTSFLLIDNASAAAYYDRNKPFENITMTNTNGLSDEEVYNIMKSVNYTDEVINKYISMRNYALNHNNDGKYYFVNGGISNMSSNRIFYNMNSDTIKSAYIEINSDGSSGWQIFYLHIQSQYDSLPYYRLDSNGNFNYSTGGWFASNDEVADFYVNNNSFLISQNSNYYNYFYETNMQGNFKYKKTNLGNYTSDITIDNNVYSINSVIPITIENGYHSLIPQGPKIYKYEDEIDTSNIDFIRFKLDVNDIISNENFVQFNYSLNGNSMDKLFYPYIETLYDYYLTADDNETSTVLYKTYELSSYSNNIFENVNQDFNSTVYYNFVIDTRNYNDNLFLNFDSYYNYEVEIYNSDGTTEVLYNTGSTLASNDYLPSYNMVTVDLSDYSGIVLMPKVFSTTDNLGLIYNAIKYDRDYRIYLNGVYDIYIRSTPGNYLTLTDTFKSYSNPYFSKRFKYISFVDNKNTNLIRIVKSSSLNNNNFITFDSNMYSYSLISSSDEVVILPDANLPDNTINSGTIDEDVSLDEANNLFEDSELSITSFINDIDETLKYVHNVFNIFFNKLPILIQSLFIFVFNIVCIFMLLRMGGWLG